jgi:adenosylcobinamide-GDP ribazoletransferase
VPVVAAAVALAAWRGAGPGDALRLLGACAVGLAVAEVVHRRAAARLGGTTGDVIGAMEEVATTAHLLVAAALWT